MSDIAPKKFDLPHLGDDLLWKIFAKADPKSVGRLKTTSKMWNFKLTSQLFVKQNFLENQHKNRSVIVGVGYPPLDDFCQWYVRAEADSGNQIQLNIPVDINNFGFYTFVGSDHGIICIRLSQGGINSSLFIWNSLTRESRFAIDVARKHQCYAVSLYAFGFLHDSFEYRVLHVFKKQFSEKNMFWALYNSFDANWKHSGSFNSDVQKLGPKAVVDKGVVYWVGWDGPSFIQPSQICTFDMLQQLFFECDIPDAAKSDYHSLTQFNSGVGFTSYHNVGFSKQIVVWQLKRDGQNQLDWERIIKVSGMAIPYNPTIFVGKDMFSVMELRTGYGGSNDTERTDLIIARLKFVHPRIEHILHHVWEENVYVKSAIMHVESLYRV